MSKVVVVESVTLDGVMQAPGRPDEDTRGGFEHGGWAVPYNDEVMGKTMGEGMANTGAMLFGRRTYEDFAGYWPQQADNPITEHLDRAQKYVVSGSLHEPLPWQNSTLVGGDPVEEVARLKKESVGNLAVLGSGVLVRSLARHGLVDEYVLLIHPLVLGTGSRLFGDHEVGALSLVSSVTTTTGVLIATYRPVCAEPASR
jgi:dihydrofolate reductase